VLNLLGYAAPVIHVRPSGYSFLPSSTSAGCAQVSIETAHHTSTARAQGLAGQEDYSLSVIDLGTPRSGRRMLWATGSAERCPS